MTTSNNTQNLKTICDGLAICSLTAGDECIDGKLLNWIENQAALLDKLGEATNWGETSLMPWAPLQGFEPGELWHSADDHAYFAHNVLKKALERLEQRLAGEGVDLKGLRLAELI